MFLASILRSTIEAGLVTLGRAQGLGASNAGADAAANAAADVAGAAVKSGPHTLYQGTRSGGQLYIGRFAAPPGDLAAIVAEPHECLMYAAPSVLRCGR